jgi:hypothetical protein
MALQDRLPELNIEQAVALLGSLAGTAFGAVKWWENRKSKGKEQKVSREEWLIDNAFDIVKELREEVARLRKQLDEERALHESRMKTMEEKLSKAQGQIRELEMALAAKRDGP